MVFVVCIFKKIIKTQDLESIRKRHDSIIFCSGCYDILQSGHAVFFEQCREFGDTLIVSVGCDKVIKSLKGPSRPVNPENNRLYLVAALEAVSYVILGEDEFKAGKIDFYNTLKILRPDVMVLNSDDSAIEHKRKLCDEFGIEIRFVDRVVPDFLVATSSSEIIDKIGGNCV